MVRLGFNHTLPLTHTHWQAHLELLEALSAVLDAPLPSPRREWRVGRHGCCSVGVAPGGSSAARRACVMLWCESRAAGAKGVEESGDVEGDFFQLEFKTNTVV